MRNLNSSMVFVPVIVGLAMSLVQVFTDSDGQRLENSVVWEVSGPNIEQPSYLVGTMHMLCEEDFSISSKMRKSFDKTQQLYLEVDFDDPEVLQAMMKESMASEPLKKRLSQVQYDRLNNYLENHSQYSIDMFEQVTYMGIVMALSMEAMSCPNIKLLDQELMVLAHKSGMSINGLETVEDRKKVLSALTPDNEQMITEDHITLFREIGNLLDNMADTYVDEDIVGLLDYSSNYSETVEDWDYVEKVTLHDRSKQWAIKIPAIAQQKPTVFAFGAGHLAGEQGVIQLLRDAGLTVKPVMK